MNAPMRWLLKTVAFGLSLLPARLFELICELTDGHAYSIAVLHTEDQVVFTMDPTVRCRRCGARISEDAYTKVSAMYAESLDA